MSLTAHHITSHSTGFPSIARIPAYNFSNFEPMPARRVICDKFAHFKFILFMLISFSITLISDGFLLWVTRLQLFMESFDVAVCAKLS